MRRSLVGVALGALTVSLACAAPALGAIQFTAEAAPVLSLTPGDQAFGAAVGDINGDGRPDVGVSYGTSSKADVYTRNAGASFTQVPGAPFNTPGGPSGIVFADFNKDGRVDFAVAKYIAESIQFFLRQSNGTYTSPPTWDAIGVGGLAVGDFNGDTWPDIAYVDYNGGNLYILRSNQSTGNPSFTQEGPFAAGANSRNVAVGDFNGDGKLDAAVPNNGTNTVSVFLRKTDNTGMTAATNITVAPAAPAPSPSGIVVADFNNDGNQDFAVSLFGINKVSTYLGTGNGTTFNLDTGSPVDFGAGANPNALGVGDFDLDGRRDLAVTQDTGNAVTILRRNTNLQGFTKESPNPITSANGLSGPDAVGVADFDGDTRPDLAVTSRNNATMRFFKNTTTIPAPINTALPQMTGTPQVGSQLSCSAGTWEGNPTSFTYVWDRAPRATTSPSDPAWTQINGSSGTTYTVQDADAGARVRCRVGAVNGFGSGEARSDSKRTDFGPPANIRPPVTTGLAVTGQTLTCDAGDWTNNPELTYAWNRGGNLIPGATGPTYQTVNAIGGDIDVRIACEVSAANDLGSGPSIRSAGVHVVSNPPANFVAPSVSVDGSSNRPVGRVATCDPGSWTQNDANYVYAWDRDGSEIGGATGKTYTTTSADLGVELRCRVKSINAAGESGFATAQAYRLRLPPGTESSQIIRSQPRGPFDPVNMMALSADYRAAVTTVVVAHLRTAVAKETDKCRSRKDLPAKAPVFKAKDFPLTEAQRCAVLVRDPGTVDIGGFGVQYLLFAAGKGTARAAQEAPCGRVGAGNCPDLGFAIDPVDPTRPGTLTEGELATLEGATPERILWDLNKDGITDVDCPATAPVMRTLPDKGTYDIRAVIVTKDSSVTNVFGSAVQQYQHFDSSSGKLRKTQPFVCRTSLDPPPDPETGPCITKGTIARVSITGNFCPVYLRALDPSVTNGLPDDVYNLLKGISDKLPIGAHKRNDPTIHVPMTTPSIWRAVTLSATDRATTGTFLNVASSLISVTRGSDVLTSSNVRLSANKLVDLFKADQFQPTRANFALDQIYWAHGASTVNGVTLDPLNNLPTLLVPTEAKEALTTIKTMIINTPAAQLGLQCRKPGKAPDFADCGLPLDANTAINATLNEAKDSGVAFLKGKAGEAADALNLDALSSDLRAKADKLTAPFKIVGNADIKLEKDGSATLTATAEIPVLKDDKGKGMRLTITLNGDQDGNLKLKGIRLGPVGAKLGGVNLSGVVVQYDDAGLAVSGQLLFPPVNQGIELKTFKITKQGKFGGLALDYLAGSGQGIPIGAVPGTYLTKLGGGVPNLENPFEVNVDAAVSAGPSAGGGCPTAGVDGQLDAKFGERNKPAFVGTFHANVIVMCLALGSVDVYVDSSPYFSVEGRAGINEGPLKVEGDVKAAVDPNRAWQLTANATLTLKGLPVVGDVGPLGGSFALSSVGVAACVKIHTDVPFVPDFKGGLGVRFPGGVPPLNIPAFLANLDAFLGCDLSDYKPLGRRLVATGAQAGTNQFTLPKDATTGILSIEGAGGAPRVKLTSPSGKVLDFTNATSKTLAPPGEGQIDEAHDRLIVIYGRAEAGRWTVTPAPGSPTISRIRIKRILPQPKVTGKLSGKGTSRTLSYNVTSIDGQQVRFMEEASGLSKSLKTIKGGGRGSFRYTIGEAQTSKRTVVAQVIQDGLPRQNITVASYTAANPAVGRPGRLKVTRKGSKATVTWRKATLGLTYEVSVKNVTRGNTNLLFPLKGKTTVVVPNVGAKDKLTVSVVAVSRGGRKGPAGRATLNPPKAKKKKKK